MTPKATPAQAAAAGRVRPRTDIRSVAVLGAGTMGAQLAAHVANAGLPVRLFDVDRAVARAGLERAALRHPNPFFTASAQRLVAFGGFESDLERLADADWIVEAVVERIDVKRELLASVDRHRAPGTPTSTNTSSLSVAALADGRSDDFRRCWLGTHFFNPPRHLHLVEIVSTRDTDPAVAARVARVCDVRLGKGVVEARDTPGFIANRIGIFDTLQALGALASGRYSVEDIDRMSGPAIGRPASATLRTLDIVGIDVAAAAIAAIGERLPVGEERGTFTVPPLLSDLLARGWSGDKTGRGFYARGGPSASATEARPSAGSTATARPSLVLNVRSMTHVPRTPTDEPSPPIGRGDVAARLRQLFLGPDAVGAYLRETLGRTLVYAAEVGGLIADSIDDIDRAMRWGFGWALGPFEIWDAVGADAVVDALGLSEPPALVATMIAPHTGRLRADIFRPLDDARDPVDARARAGHRLRQTPVGRLVDLDDVLHAEVWGGDAGSSDAAQFLDDAVAAASAGARALVIGLDPSSFDDRSFVRLLLADARAHQWDAIDRKLRAIQQVGLAIRSAEIPIVVCASGRLVGESCALALQAGHIQAAAELRLGLVEVALGLVPANGGLTALVVRALRHGDGERADLVAAVRPIFDLLLASSVSTSAPHARVIGYLRPRDGITMNADRVAQDAIAVARIEATRWRETSVRKQTTLAGGDTVAAALKLAVHLSWRAGRITAHDALVARALATVIAGGTHPRSTEIDIGRFLDLEREAFLGLCGESKTLDRLEHFAATGHMLRN